MSSLETEIGRIYYRYDDEHDLFEKIRLTNITVNDDKVKTYHFCNISDKTNHILPETEVLNTQSEYDEILRNWGRLESSGIVTVTNIVAIENEVRQIKDVAVIFFPNNKVTNTPESNQPYVIARQGINNVFNPLSDTVGCAISLETLPDGYSLGDFLICTSAISSRMCHLYKTDTETDLGILLKNEETDMILKDLYDHEYNVCKNTIQGFGKAWEDKGTLPPNLNGYNLSFEDFLRNTGFLNETDHILGIANVDFELQPCKGLDIDDKLLLSTLYGGIKIDKAVGIRFNYDIDLNKIKTNYLLVRDQMSMLWIVAYTKSPDEIDAIAMYNLTEERTLQLQERLRRCANAASIDSENSTKE